MPSLAHEALLTLFRRRPELAPELLRDALHVSLPPYSEVRIESAELTDVVPTEYRADLVVLLVAGRPALAIVVEVQLRRDERKRTSWPVYVATVRARFSCPSCVLVVTPSENVARWARIPIEIGPGNSMSPLVVGPSAVPVVTEPDAAVRDPELAVLSVMAHGRGDQEIAVSIATAAFEGATGLKDDRAMLYWDLILLSLGKAARVALEGLMANGTYEYRSDFAKKYMAQGRAEGRAEGKVAAVLHILEVRGIALTDEQRRRISVCTDTRVIDRWIERAVSAASADQLFDD